MRAAIPSLPSSKRLLKWTFLTIMAEDFEDSEDSESEEVLEMLEGLMTMALIWDDLGEAEEWALLYQDLVNSQLRRKRVATSKSKSPESSPNRLPKKAKIANLESSASKIADGNSKKLDWEKEKREDSSNRLIAKRKEVQKRREQEKARMKKEKARLAEERRLAKAQAEVDHQWELVRKAEERQRLAAQAEAKQMFELVQKAKGGEQRLEVAARAEESQMWEIVQRVRGEEQPSEVARAEENRQWECVQSVEGEGRGMSEQTEDMRRWEFECNAKLEEQRMLIVKSALDAGHSIDQIERLLEICKKK